MVEGKERQPRFVSWEDYGIDNARHRELQKIVQSGKYDDAVFSAACRADEKAAGHIILSVKKNLSYEHIEFHEELGRCTLGRTNFYGARRLFFHYLDVMIKDMQENSGKEETDGKA